MVKMKKAISLLIAVVMAVLMMTPAVSAIPIHSNVNLAREISNEGIVLLKNENNALPLAANEKVALFGSAQIYTGSTSNGYQIGGGGSGALTPAYTPKSPADALLEAGIDVYAPLTNAYKQSISYVPTATMYDNAAAYAQTAIMFINRYSQEDSDLNPSLFSLSSAEATMMREISAHFETVIVLPNIVSAIDTSWAKGDVAGIDVDALAILWTGGSEGPNSMVDILTGKANPSGKLNMTFAKNINDYPTTDDYTVRYVSTYEEDIFVGYRYFETFNIPVNYEFGFGLSYTTFEFSDVEYRADNDTIFLDVTVTNTGDVAGKEVVQVYYAAPQMGTGGAVLSKSVKDLAAFAKTNLLAPGQSQKISLSYPIKDMATFDDTGLTGNKSAYVLEAGDYNVYVGNSVKNVEPAGTWTLDTLTVTEQLTQLCQPVDLRQRLLADGTYESLQTKTDLPVVNTTSVTKVEAETFTASVGGYNGSARIEDFSNDTGTGQCVGWLHNSAGSYVEYVLNVEEAGDYDIVFRAASDRVLNNCMRIFINGQLAPDINLSMPRTSTPGNTYFAFIDTVSNMITLPKGVVTLRFATNGSDLPNIDYFAIQKHIDYVNISATEPSVLETENYSSSVSNDGVNVTSETFTNGVLLVDGVWQPYSGGCLAWMHRAGNSATYHLLAEEEGDYTIDMRVANGGGALTDFATIAVNSVSTNIQVSCASTRTDASQWYSFIDMPNLGTVHLNKGVNVFTIIAKGNSFPNIDSFTFKPVTEGVTEAATNFALAPLAAPLRAPDDYIIQLKDVAEGLYTIEELVAQMTVEELASYTSGMDGGTVTSGSNTGTLGGSFAASAKYGIPRADTADGPGGLRLSTRSTAWPCQTLMACTWNTELSYRWGDAVGKEAVVNQIDIWLAPGLNLLRGPLCGRNFEYSSEDPFLAGKMVAAEVRGVQQNGVCVTVKHFAANNKEWDRRNDDSRVSERALRQLYLRSFQIVLQEGDAWGIMTSYNLINGVKVGANADLLTGILHNEWDWDGLVVTDWWMDCPLVDEIKAGSNVRMPSTSTTPIVTAVNNGTMSRATLENSVIDVIETIMKLQCFTGVVANLDPLAISPTVPTKIEGEDFCDAYQLVRLVYNSLGDGSTRIAVGTMDAKDASGAFAAFVTYKINVEKSGTYDLVGHIANQNSGQNALEVSLDGAVYEDVVFDSNSTGSWNTYENKTIGTIYLPEGEHLLKLKAKASPGNIDYLVFTPNTLDAVESITAPESAIRNEAFDVTVTTENAISKLIVKNENGGKMGISIQSVTNNEGNVVTVFRLAVGTAGAERVFSVYDGEKRIGTFTIAINNPETAIVSVAAPSEVNANESFSFTTVTTKDLTKGKLYNERGGVIGTSLVSKVINGDYATCVYTTLIGTAMAEARTFTFKADFDKHNEFPYSRDIQILVK